MPVADRGSHVVHFEVLGPDDAPPLLLVMGLGFSSRAWQRLPARLAQWFRVITFDNRGTGRSTAPRGLCRVGDMADDAAAVLDAAGVLRAYVFGISMGGMIALELALRHPDRVRGLALGATFAGWLRSRKATPRTVLDVLLGTVLAIRLPPRRLARVLVSAEHFARDAEGFAAWLAGAEHASRGVAALQVAAVALHRTERRLARIRAPTLVLTGDADRLVPPENSRRLAALIPGARLVELRGAGHCFPVEQPAAVADALTAFFLGDTAALPRGQA